MALIKCPECGKKISEKTTSTDKTMARIDGYGGEGYFTLKH